MLTQRDIAQELGVSVSSVSLVLSGAGDGRVRPEMAAKIRELAEGLGYVPNYLARSLKRGQTHTIGLVADEVATVPFSGQLLAGAQERAWRAQYMLLLIDVAGQTDLETVAVQSLLQRSIEALIIAAAHHRVVDVPLVPHSMPVVVLDGKPASDEAEIDWVVPDETGGAHAAVRHLVDHGHRRIGFVTASARYPIAAALRLDGYRSALAEGGIAVDDSLIVEADDASTAGARPAVCGLLDRPDPPSAVFCFGDQIAMAVYQYAAAHGLSIPGDLSVVGFDNQQFVADSLWPPLTTVQLPHRAMGEWAVERALARLVAKDQDFTAAHHLMDCPLIERESVASPR